jgi:hypothetical protein
MTHYKRNIQLEHKHWLPKDLQRCHQILFHLHQHDCIMDISMTCPFSWIWYSTTLIFTNYNCFTFFEKKSTLHFEMLKCFILLNNGYKRCKKSSIQCNIDFVCVKQLRCWWKDAITTNCICINVFQVPCCNEHFKIFCTQKSTNEMLRSFTL